MQETEYLEIVTGQMRCKKAQDMVAEELRQHIEDQTAKYMEFGMNEEDARKRAVEQMGDPVYVGTQMDCIHRPGMDKNTFLFICFMSVFGAFLWHILAGSDGGVVFDLGAFAKTLLSSCLPGILIMFLVMRMDYTLLGRHPFVAAMMVIGCAWIYNLQSSYPSNGKYGMNYLFLAFVMFFYGAAVYALREKGYKGIFLCLVWLFAQTVLLFLSSGHFINLFNFFINGLLVMSVAAWKGWFGVERKKALPAIWGSVTVPACFLFFAGALSNGYRWHRLQGWFVAADSQFNYVISRIREEISGAGLLHGTGNSMPVDSHNQNEYFLISLISRHGYLAAFLIMALLGILLFLLMKGIKNAKNRLGTLMGCAAVFSLMLPVLEHLLYNIGLIPAGSLVLPFFSAAGSDAYLQGSYCTGAILAYYAAMGICLSVYRIRNVVFEKRRVCYENV